MWSNTPINLWTSFFGLAWGEALFLNSHYHLIFQDILVFSFNAPQGFEKSISSMVDFNRFLPPLAHKLIVSLSERGVAARH